MLSFRVRRFKGQSRGRKGEDVVVLTDLRGSPTPHYHPNFYVISEYRQVGRSAHTIEKVLRAIGMAKSWAEMRGRDLDYDLTAGPFLNGADVLDLVRFLSLNATDQQIECESVKPESSVVSFAARRKKDDQGDGPYGVVPSVEVGNRIRWIANYIEWHRARRFDNRDLVKTEAHQNASVLNMLKDLRGKAPGDHSRWHDDELLEAPDSDVLQRIDEILVPGSNENPFQSEFIQWRNYLAWRLLFDTGARRSEVTTAATDSVIGAKNRFQIRESKTIARTVPIIKKTADVFDHFFMTFWLKMPEGCEAHRTGALFTNKAGVPLTSGKFLNRIFLAVRPILGSQPWQLTPHMMRRAWNHILSLKLDRLPKDQRFSPEKEAQMRIRLMGWSESSRQPARYNRRHIRENADRIAQEMMDELQPADEYLEKSKQDQ
ncbi:site-specific integrase [Sphingopyxis sp.]|jgi:integrase|uniref:site-specific integrase n=1 Tax=Sphingopyxis sp. TaxID=1908224 RepID=UPI002E0EAEC2